MVQKVGDDSYFHGVVLGVHKSSHGAQKDGIEVQAVGAVVVVAVAVAESSD